MDNDDENSKSVRRIVTVNAYARAWEKIRVKSSFFSELAFELVMFLN